MAIKPEKIAAGMTLYRRYKRRMGNTTMKEWTQSSTSILSVDAASGYALCRDSMGERRISLRVLSKMDSWSMYDKDQAILHKSMSIGHTMGVERRKPCTKCQKRHAAEVCPAKGTA